MKSEYKHYIEVLQKEFVGASNNVLALQQKAYLKNKFEHLGLTATVRRELQRPFLSKAYLPDKKEAFEIVKLLWSAGRREYQHFAQELFFKYAKQFEEEDLKLIEYIIVHDSWWDTIDFIATKIVAQYFLSFPEKRDEVISRWIESGDLWLRRSAILFQLKYKDQLDIVFLTSVIDRLIPSKEFFINKAIGWILREYAKTHPDWVQEYVAQTPLSNLSKREALKHFA